MKTILLLLVSLFTSGCYIVAKKQNVTMENILSMELSKVIINDEKLDSLIAVVISDNRDYLIDTDCFLLMENIKGDNGTSYVNILIYEKAKFTLTCAKSDYPILGYCEVNNQTVFIVGQLRFKKMQFLEEKKTFNFRCEKTEKEDIVPPPPSMYNPPFYTFPY